MTNDSGFSFSLLRTLNYSEAVCNIHAPVSTAGASSRAAASRPANACLPIGSLPATFDIRRATSQYQQKCRRPDPLVPPRALAPPDASSAYPRWDPDGPGRSYSDEHPRLSTRSATCQDRLIRKARCLFCGRAATSSRSDPVSPSPSTVAVLRQSVSNRPYYGCPPPCPGELLPLPTQEPPY